jgi:hypothetical protein
MLSLRELCFGRLQFLQSAFPLRFEPACDEPVFRVDRAIAALGALGAVARAFDVAPELCKRRLVICFELLDGLQGCGQPRRCERREERRGNRGIDLNATDCRGESRGAVGWCACRGRACSGERRDVAGGSGSRRARRRRFARRARAYARSGRR